METAAPVLFDALVLPTGQAAINTLLASGQAMDFVRAQYRHCKTILALNGSSALLEAAGVPHQLSDGQGDPGLLVVSGQDAATIVGAFVKAIAQHRHFERQMNPPSENGEKVVGQGRVARDTGQRSNLNRGKELAPTASQSVKLEKTPKRPR